MTANTKLMTIITRLINPHCSSSILGRGIQYPILKTHKHNIEKHLTNTSVVSKKIFQRVKPAVNKKCSLSTCSKHEIADKSRSSGDKFPTKIRLVYLEQDDSERVSFDVATPWFTYLLQNISFSLHILCFRGSGCSPHYSHNTPQIPLSGRRRRSSSWEWRK